MENQTSPNPGFYKISSQLKNEAPHKTERLLKAILKQKRLGTPIGYGKLPPSISQMSMYEYLKRLSFIQNLVTHKFREHIHRLHPGTITATSAEERLSYMLKTINKDLVLLNGCLIQNHSVDILLLDYQIAIEVNGGIHNAEFKMSQDTFKAEQLHKNFKIHTMTVENGDIVRMANSISAQIKNHELTKGDRKRIKKLFRDIPIKTIAYWIAEEDILKLLLINKDSPPVPACLFKSKILRSPSIALSEEPPMLTAA